MAAGGQRTARTADLLRAIDRSRLPPWQPLVTALQGGGIILNLGNYFFTEPSGAITKVEYSFSYGRGSSGELLIQLHHSSLPYSSS